MNQMYMLLLGVLGVAAIGSLLHTDDNDEIDEGTPVPELPFKDGTDEDDVLDGTPGAEILRGLEGDDTLDAGAGDDWIYAGTGEDVVIADPGNDRVFLGEGDDLYGSDEDPTLNDGNDTIEGGSGDDTVFAGGGDDLVLAGDDDKGNDVLNGGYGADTIDGGKGDDVIGAADRGDGAADSLLGGEGNDTLTLDAGDIGDGGEGSDDYLLTAHSGASTVIWGKGDKLIISYTGSVEQAPEVELVQSGDDSRLMVDGQLLAVVKGAKVDDVRFELNPVAPRSGGGYVVPVTDPQPVVIDT